MKCPICRAEAAPAGRKQGRRTGRFFELERCPACGFAFVTEPLTDYGAIYDEQYYSGKGSDPPIDYAFEFEHPGASIRQYEWRAWERMIPALAGPGFGPEARWLDYGCGCGTLVRYLRDRGRTGVCGFDLGTWAEKARRAGVAILTEAELAEAGGSFEIITAIDVIEHIPDPLAFLRRMRSLLQPGGILVALTQNAEIAPRAFASWSYVRPEIHVSFFTPDSLGRAFRLAGFEPFHPGPLPGWSDLMRCRVLKNLRIKRTNPFERILPWALLGRLADLKVKMNALPFGRAV